MKGLLKRAFTALVFVIVMLGGLYGGRYSFVLLFAIITVLCLWEYYSMVLVRNTRRDYWRKLLGVGMGLVPFMLVSIVQLNLVNNPEDFVLLSSLLLSPFIFSAFIYELYMGSELPFTNIAFIVLGVIYIGVPFALLDFVAFNGEFFYADTVFGLLLMTWANDTGAYLVGSQFGKHRLFERISPKKTWEGTIGGIVITLIIAFVLSLIFTELQTIDWLILGLIIAIFGTLGDLVESMLKRSVHVKDSGNLLPGHGGVLDRFDGFIFVLPFVTAYLLWIR
ncbi:MAG: phosphatidate cytidylyltransferase [Saprospiraceae bacterium]